MAYTKFKSEIETAKALGLVLKRKNLFQNVQPLESSAWLNESLESGIAYAPASEKARNELIVMPILLEIIKLYATDCSVVSGAELNVAPDLGLKGFVDFIICRQPLVYYLQAPLVAIVEAKKADIELGIGQAIAETMAIKLYNEKHNDPTHRIYGCVTNGKEWRFLYLENDVVYLDLQDYFINDLPILLGVWKHILTKENN